MSSSIAREKPRYSSPGWKFLKEVSQVTGGTLLAVIMLTSAIVAGGLVGLAISFRNLPDVRVLRNYIPSETSYFYDINGKVLASIHGEANREVIPLNRISPELKRAVLAIEDSHFYSHNGINISSVGRASIVNWQRGAVAEGGSTLTMQLVKNIFLTQQRRFSRKVAEAVLAIRLEQILSKDQILEMYLNQVYWGHNTYGVETAAQSYFGKSAADLNLAEAAMMAGIIQAPQNYSPFVSMKTAKQRQETVLNRMRSLGWITAEEDEKARETKITLGKVRSFQRSSMPFVTNTAAQELEREYGLEAVQKGGLRVQTTVDSRMQQIAEETVAKWHKTIRSQGVRADQMALVSVDPRTQFIKALVGGVDYQKSEFNRATQARRQPGSSFKPFVYYTAFASGKFTPNSVINDTPVSYRIPGGIWTPKNYDDSFNGPMPVRRSLEVSRNIPAVKLGSAVGLNKVVETCRILGINSPMEPVPSLPLGAIGVTPLEMASAYATIANYGWQSKPTIIARVTDSSGNVILDNSPKPQLVLEPWAAATLTDVMKGVITSGTGTAAQIGRPAAGKTGTTSSERDIWFVGFVPQLATAVWVGNDNYQPVGKGATGGVFVAPIWRSFMSQALKNTPVENFRPPSQFDRPK
ncbi:MAG: Penicillin-binding protein 2D [Chroococcidiopsis cubana SAG 39.79]|uniref:transglycosylase domain-containing protein n=1 Tax=Chroococcidiopsis TaxID=54298 RepID=UPI000D0761FA|nr:MULTISPECIES: transglycosylase domain-containing protein [Chroococcidiopsis]MDZ4872045.1 Penicillin-binding protein 2D [Chroococcidiopsis cubana SAG 39.79]PSB64165.1 penicillin-binding protein [Chroococcidiopsis cubana CCALA 043]URD47773.1 penicillin-binding protein [Chroococcidiopsis sp. CCNUC1]